MGSFDRLGTSRHHLDLQLDFPRASKDSIQLVVEELPESLQFASDCASSMGSFSTASSLGCGSFSSASCIASMGSITSSGG